MKVMRRIINIDEEKCDGCGLCAEACHEGAIQIIDGKAKLVRDDYCDGLGDCIGECPQDAISFEKRMAAPFDEEAVQQHLAGQKKAEAAPAGGGCLSDGCPGSAIRDLFEEGGGRMDVPAEAEPGLSELRNWPVQIHLVPPTAPYFDGADLLISADCAPFAVPDFHSRHLRGRVALVGCPKLDEVDRYRQKLAAIFANNDIRSIEVLRMQVPCCGGLTNLVEAALEDSGVAIPAGVTIVSPDGERVDRSLIVASTKTG